jgi:uncharacterized surface protein with fasciclin (FAS1) repeats
MSGTIASIVAASPNNFSVLGQLLDQAGLTGVLNGPGQFTVFAPNNAAFAKLSPQLVADLTRGDPSSQRQLQDVLKYHVLPTIVTSSAIGGTTLTPHTLQGKNLCVYRDASNQVHVNQAKVIRADIPATNGIIHVITDVLIPSYSDYCPV